ncbi:MULTISPECIES: hypothetical protein [Pseudomonas]|uniref:Peptidase metallopeptidase domain-containing protein n=1 Tax=Pseudomonas koreensis TaxID=198620 RepID=A0AA94ELL7_9PSED|nr:hypothetical protein [Pseudomonas koreensis]RVD76521.1 hypothetical protein A9HBioS_3505 [Pseudomonas koreensis]
MWAKNNPSKFWTPGCTLRIAFLNGTQEFKEATIAAASNWLPHINLKFAFVDGEQGDIRILSEEGTFSSYIGTDALLFPDEPTMRLWPHPPSQARYFAANVMHEFGHMLGVEHEQTNPTANIPWNKPAIYEQSGITDNPEDDNYQARVTRERLHQWYFDLADPSESIYSEYDRKSIMHYAVSQSWTVGDFQIFINLDLSEKDKAFMAKAYPYPASE